MAEPLSLDNPMWPVAWIDRAQRAPELDVKTPEGVLAKTPYIDDNGLGFTQGSTGGVLNTYYRGGFHRPQLPEFSLKDRNAFNLRSYRGTSNSCTGSFIRNPYACHYDPKPYFDEGEVSSLRENKKIAVSSSQKSTFPYLGLGVAFLLVALTLKISK